MTDLALLANEVGVSERTLRRAVTDGAIRGTRATPRKLHLALGEQQYIRRSWPLLSTLRSVLRTEPNVRFALLFGSAARGIDTSGSDVDVLVEMSDASLDRVVALSSKLTLEVGRPVDVVRFQDAEADAGFLADVLSHGRVLVDREGSWPRMLDRQAKLKERGRREEIERTDSALAGIDLLFGKGG